MESLNPFPTLAEIEYEQSHYESYLAKLQAIQVDRLVEDRDDDDDMLFDPSESEETANIRYMENRTHREAHLDSFFTP